MSKIDGIQQRLHDIPALRERLLEVASTHGTPVYVYDEAEAKQNLESFRSAFAAQGIDISVFYAIKSNPYQGLLSTLVTEDAGLDASSRRELRLALEAGAQRIIYTGPAKVREDFEAIIEHADRITVNLESARELVLLSELATKKGVKVRCGLRVVTSSQKGWTKFGQPLNALKDFFDQASALPGIEFCGMHFHISMNKVPDKYVSTLQEIGEYMHANFSSDERACFQYIDIGGGYYPCPFEGTHAWNPKQTMSFFAGEEHIEAILADTYNPKYLPITAVSIEEFAQAIAGAFNVHIAPVLPNVHLYAEPGRYISHSVMHMLLSIVEKKDAQHGITDGGNNMIGWEKHQFFNYTPLFNLTNFSAEREIPFIMYGSLCTPDDIWGYYLYCSSIEDGDIIAMPFQGAYTYTLAQEFIKDIPPVIDIN